MSKKKPRPEPWSLGLPATGVDSHAHLDMPPLVHDLDQVLDRARSSGLSRIGQVFLGPQAYDQGKSLFRFVPWVFFIMGVHPHDSEKMQDEDLDRMARAFARDTRLRALGEIGLDHHYDHSPRWVQKKRFQDQLVLARELDLPVVIHSREAEEDTLDLLLETGFSGRPLLWHCFGRDADLAQTILSHGWDISIPGTVTFAKNTLLHQAVASIPAHRLHLETDCPFLAPHPYRGKTNEPALSVFTAQAVARIQGRPVDKVWSECGENSIRFFGLA
jgi:TatD DNase family protein